MLPIRLVRACVIVCVVVGVLGRAALAPADGNGPNMFGFTDPTGIVRTFSANGATDFDNEFFQALGTNGRSCGSCHQPADGWTLPVCEIRRNRASAKVASPKAFITKAFLAAATALGRSCQNPIRR